jgi:hypothetical protein
VGDFSFSKHHPDILWLFWSISHVSFNRQKNKIDGLLYLLDPFWRHDVYDIPQPKIGYFQFSADSLSRSITIVFLYATCTLFVLLLLGEHVDNSPEDIYPFNSVYTFVHLQFICHHRSQARCNQ